MRLLTTHEIGVLRGDLQNVVLPEFAELYVSAGLRQMFRRVSLDKTDTFEDSWLYIPLEQIFSVRQNLIVAGNNPAQICLSHEPIEIDGLSLYPVLMKGKIRGVIVNRSERPLHLSSDAQEIILGSLETFQFNLERSAFDSVDVFIKTLLQPESTFESFALRFLNLLTQTCEGSCAGLYYNHDGVYTLRLVSGDLGKFDQLAGELKIATAQQWQNMIRQRYFFTPADLVPPHPVLLAAPPQFRFVHPGSGSEHTDYIVTMIVGGDISYTDLRQVLDLARYASGLADSQFVRTGDILNLYGEFVDSTARSIPPEELLPQLFSILAGQLSMSRLMLIEKGKTGYIVRARHEDKLSVDRVGPDMIPGLVRDALRKDRSFCLRKVAEQITDIEFAKTYYLDNVKSEIYFAIPDEEGQEPDILAIGTPLEGEYLCNLKDFLTRVAQFVRHYQKYRRGRQLVAVPGQIVDSGQHALLLSRFETAAKLSGGYFHDVLSQMSVICGQAEILAQDLRSEDVKLCDDDLVKGIERLMNAGDLATEYLTILRELSLLTKERLASSISAQDLLHRLALLTQGYAHQIRDTKNVTLEFQTHASPILDFSFALRDVYDVVFPVVLAIMEQAVCSGEMCFCIRCDAVRDSLVIRYDLKITPHIDVEDFLLKTFAGHTVTCTDTDQAKVTIGGAVVVGSKIDNKLLEIEIAKPVTQLPKQLDWCESKAKKL